MVSDATKHSRAITFDAPCIYFGVDIKILDLIEIYVVLGQRPSSLGVCYDKLLPGRL